MSKKIARSCCFIRKICYYINIDCREIEQVEMIIGLSMVIFNENMIRIMMIRAVV